MKLRLLITEQCNRSCAGCCNEDWDLANLPVCDTLTGWDEILITGGEPMLFPGLIPSISRQADDAMIYVYTAKVDNLDHVSMVLNYVDGMTITLHEQSDVPPFVRMCEELWDLVLDKQSGMRLNVFEGVVLPPDLYLAEWGRVKQNMVWMKNCPLPKDEVFQRYERQPLSKLGALQRHQLASR